MDDVTIAAGDGFQGSALGRRTGRTATMPGVAKAFDDLLRGFAFRSRVPGHAPASSVEPRQAAARPDHRKPVPRAIEDRADDAVDRDPDRPRGAAPIGSGEAPRSERRDPPPARATAPEHDFAVALAVAEAPADEVPSPAAAHPLATNAEGSGTVPAQGAWDPKTGRPATGSTADLSPPLAAGGPPPETTVRPADAEPSAAQGAGARAQFAATGIRGDQTDAPGEVLVVSRQAGDPTPQSGQRGRAPASATIVSGREPLTSQPTSTLVAGAAVAVAGDGTIPARSGNRGSALAENGAAGSPHPTAAHPRPQPAAIAQIPSTHAAHPTTAAAVAAVTATAAATAVPAGSSEPQSGDAALAAGAPAILGESAAAAAPRTGGVRPQSLHRSIAEQISVSITRAVRTGVDRIEIQLRPATLGRVEVSLEVARDGRVIAVVSADARETLEMLRSDARGLERALQDAGLKTDSGSLSFNLRGEDAGGRHGGAADPTVSVAEPAVDTAAAEESTPVATTDAPGRIATDGRVDIIA